MPVLDGIRGTAILAVLLFHFIAPENRNGLANAAVSWVFSYGALGVDLFFVLSGFLITGILYDSRTDAHYFRNFYMRRLLRIFPLYYGVLVIIFLGMPLIPDLRGTEIVELRAHQAWAWLVRSQHLLGHSRRLGAFIHRALLVAGSRGTVLPDLATGGLVACS